MDLRNTQSPVAAGGGLQNDRQTGRIAEEANIAEGGDKARAKYADPQDQLNFSQDAVRSTAAGVAVQSAYGASATDARNSRASADGGDAVKNAANAGAVTSGGAKQTDRKAAPEGLSLDKISGDLVFEYADINGAHSAVASPLQTLDASVTGETRNGNGKTLVTPAEKAETEREEVSVQAFEPFNGPEAENALYKNAEERKENKNAFFTPPGILAENASAGRGAFVDFES